MPSWEVLIRESDFMTFEMGIADGIRNEELANAVRSAQKLTDGAYELYNRNEETIMKLLQKILRLSKEEKVWHLYFYALYEIMYEAVRCGNYPAVVKYAEVYYKDSDLYMDKELPNYPQTNMSYLNTWIYDQIFSAYFQYHQIDDAKMDAFMKKFEEAALKYGRTVNYYECELELGALYRDPDLLERGKKKFEKYEHEIKGCYVCHHKPLFGYYLYNGLRELAVEFFESIVQKRIPKQHQWCYEYCEAAEADDLCAYLLQISLRLGRAEEFQYFFEKYWLKLAEKKREGEFRTTYIYADAIAGKWEQMSGDLHMAEQDVAESAKNTTVDNIEFGLMWWCYFALLDQSGVHEVTISLPGLAPKENGKTDCRDISVYFEKRADEYGMKFAQARVKYDYGLMKKTYRECAGLYGKPDGYFD